MPGTGIRAFPNPEFDAFTVALKLVQSRRAFCWSAHPPSWSTPMFDFAWSEIGVIGVVALVWIGPKDMPAALRAVSGVIKKARRMAAEFQTHVDDMMRDANLQEVRNQISEIRNFDLKGTIERAVDPDYSIRNTFADNPLVPDPPKPSPPLPTVIEVPPSPVADVAEIDKPAVAETAPRLASTPSADEVEGDAPAFIPPAYIARPKPPAFIPPGTHYHNPV